MADQITLEEALELVEFELCPEGWRVKNVNGSVYGDVLGKVWGDVCCNVYGNVYGTINSRQWMFIGTPKEELKYLIEKEELRCLIEEDADKNQLLAALDRLEDSDD